MSAVGSSADSSSICAAIRLAISSSTCCPSTTIRCCSSRSYTESDSVMDVGAARRMVAGAGRPVRAAVVSCWLTSPCLLLMLAGELTRSLTSVPYGSRPYADQPITVRARRRCSLSAARSGGRRRSRRRFDDLAALALHRCVPRRARRVVGGHLGVGPGAARVVGRGVGGRDPGDVLASLVHDVVRGLI